mmetsp:Transcript_3706/g.13099  ORF Transcript_3706/g.13099 Transcript_3706/m.13099 type:complete len:236 (+) Transcript_3706:27-734(+)
MYSLLLGELLRLPLAPNIRWLLRLLAGRSVGVVGRVVSFPLARGGGLWNVQLGERGQDSIHIGLGPGVAVYMGQARKERCDGLVQHRRALVHAVRREGQDHRRLHRIEGRRRRYPEALGRHCGHVRLVLHHGRDVWPRESRGGRLGHPNPSGDRAVGTVLNLKALEDVLATRPELLEAVAVDEHLRLGEVYVALEGGGHLGLHVCDGLDGAARVLKLQEEVPHLPGRLWRSLQRC